MGDMDTIQTRAASGRHRGTNRDYSTDYGTSMSPYWNGNPEGLHFSVHFSELTNPPFYFDFTGDLMAADCPSLGNLAYGEMYFVRALGLRRDGHSGKKYVQDKLKKFECYR